jgi:hypothetical protein
MRRIVTSRASSTTFTRPTVGTGSLGETTETTSQYTEQAWLYNPRERTTQADAGERILGDMRALVVADSDYDPDTDEPPVQKDDRTTHGGIEYEVLTVTAHPDEQDPDLWMVELERRQQ